MIKTISFKNAIIRYSVKGDGPCLFFLHGYLETLEVWDEYTDSFKADYKTIAMDIPGHGESGLLGNKHTMALMADAVNHVLMHEKIEKCFLTGHSMGGYATLAFVDKYPYKLTGYCLFHSAPFADTDIKKQNRDREIALVKEGKSHLLFNSNIPKMFADDNLEKLAPEIKKIQSKATMHPDKGIIALLEGMKLRPDRSQMLKDKEIPCLWILGEKDNYIPFEIVKEKLSLLNEKGQAVALKNSGHIGFIEEKEASVNALKAFLNKVEVQ